jgi:class 3 adenylate cyclase
MESIEDLLRLRRDLLKEIDQEIEKGHTRTVTLLFTDIVGSTTFFEKMGDIAGRQMVQTHNELLFPIITAFDGRVIKTIGDSIMASFEDSARAVLCTVEMQKAIQAHNREVSTALGFRVRMGLHCGRAVVEEKDLFGDVVNTAARVESKADGDEILASGAVKESAPGLDVPFVFLGTETVKGKEEKIDFYFVNWKGIEEKEILESWRVRVGKKPASGLASGAPNVLAASRVAFKGRLETRKELEAIPPIPSRGNPYLNRVMIPHPEMFFGRKALFRKVMSRVSAQRPQSVSLVGERRIGKSSLLNFLRSPKARLELLEEADTSLFLYVDFQQTRAPDPDQFFGLIFSEFQKRFSTMCELDLPVSADGMRALCEAVANAGLRLVFLFDEFECVTKNAKIGPEFYSFLRSMANGYPVCFVTASGRELKDMCVSHEISDSPFFNIFSVHHIGAFKEGEAEELISKPSEARALPLAPLRDRIMEMGGFYPFFLQMACSAWFEYLEDSGGKAESFRDDPVPREVLETFREETRPHFEFVLESAGAEERDALFRAAEMGWIETANPAGIELERKGYLRQTPDGFSPFCAEFGAFLNSQRGSRPSG